MDNDRGYRSGLKEQAGIAVAEEAEVVGEGEVVDLPPISAEERRDEQKQRRLRLMEVGYHTADDVEMIARSDDYLRRPD